MTTRRGRGRLRLRLAAARTIAAVVAVAAIGLTVGCRHPDPTSVAVEAMAATRASTPRPAGPLRVATYNIHHIGAGELETALAADPDLAAAEVVFLQEVVQPRDRASVACEVGRLHGWHCAYAPGHGLDGGSLGVAILSRRPLADLESIELPFFHVRFNAGRRVALAATIDLDGTPVRLYSVHLDNRLNPGQRIRQLAPVMDAAAAWDGPAVIAGDMNTSPFVWLGHVVPVPAGVQDDRLERYVRGRGFTTPVVGSGATHKWLSMRLDAIYTRGLGVVAHEVEHGVRHSDHLPLWADLTL
ncbi:MAG: endonuclease/exonuclease/phosphatase family protein [Kofleriaceae bacterium]|nr:endonuclease/exonuclease/phosphatase family protein [Kofleriaceae bacterium]MCL4224286.1 endonuclease/exonuclease/phosphatase family protein [Myxococcales bacterium]